MYEPRKAILVSLLRNAMRAEHGFSRATPVTGRPIRNALFQIHLWLALILFLPMAVIVFASGLFLPNTNAGALSVHPELAGSAAGLTGFLQMSLGAILTVAIARGMTTSEAPVIVATSATTLISALALLLLRLR